MHNKKCKTCDKEFLTARRDRVFYCSLSCSHIKHGMSRTAVYKVYQAMIDRCSNENNKSYSEYGGRGIFVCEEWNSFENFYRDMGEPNGKSLDRIDNNKGYSKENCRWATEKEQSNNTRSNRLLTHDGKTLNITQWSELLGIDRNTIKSRLRYGWSDSEALKREKTTTRRRRSNLPTITP